MKAVIEIEKLASGEFTGRVALGDVSPEAEVQHADLGWLLAHLSGRVTSAAFALPPRDFAKEVRQAEITKEKADRRRKTEEKGGESED